MAETITIIIWGILAVLLTGLIIFLVLTSKSRSDEVKKKQKSLKLIFMGVIFAGVVGIGSYLFFVPQFSEDRTAIRFPSTGSDPTTPVFIQCTKSLYATPIAGLISSSLFTLIIFLVIVLFRNIFIRREIEKDLENARIAAKNVLEDLQTERKMLAEAKAKDEALLASIGEGVIAVDQDGKVILINKVTEDLLGFTNTDVLGKSLVHIIAMQDAQGSQISDKLRPITLALNSGKTTISSSYQLVRKDGKKIPVAVAVTPVLLDSKAAGAMFVFRDITKEKEIEREKSEFVSLASHQLRTPLTGIEWTIEVFLRKEKLTKEGTEYLSDIHSSTQRLSTLVKLLLDVSRIESGRVGISPETLELVDFINQYAHELQGLCEKKKLSLIFVKHPKKLAVVTDKNMFAYILQNLFSNAINYTLPDGEIEISLEEKQDNLLLTVRDTGIGIPQKEQGRIFKKFVRASNAVAAKPDGTGLGLYIASEAVKLLGGKIWFESEEGKGSAFFVELPRVSLSRAGEKGIALGDHFTHSKERDTI